MLFLTLLSYLASLIQLCFLTVAVGNYGGLLPFEHTLIFATFSAAGLYYLAELVEEFPRQGKKIVWWLNFVRP